MVLDEGWWPLRSGRRGALGAPPRRRPARLPAAAAPPRQRATLYQEAVATTNVVVRPLRLVLDRVQA